MSNKGLIQKKNLFVKATGAKSKVPTDMKQRQ